MEVTGQLFQAGQHAFGLHQTGAHPAGPILVCLQALQLFFALLRGHLPGGRIRQGEGLVQQARRQTQRGDVGIELHGHVQKLVIPLRMGRRRIRQLQYRAPEPVAQQVANPANHGGHHHFQIRLTDVAQRYAFDQAETHPGIRGLNTRDTQTGAGAEIALQQAQGIAQIRTADRRIAQQAMRRQCQLLAQGQAQRRVAGHLAGAHHHPAELLKAQCRLRVVHLGFVQANAIEQAAGVHTHVRNQLHQVPYVVDGNR